MRRRRRHEENENSERWVVSYADFITLMFAFFAVLYATSQKDMEKAKEFEDSINKYLVKVEVRGGGGGKSKIENQEKKDSVIASPLSQHNASDAAALQAKVSIETQLEENLSEDDLEKYITDIATDKLGVRVSVDADAIFPAGDEKFNSDAPRILDRIAQSIKNAGRKVIVQGHMENENFSSSRYPSSWELSAARAATVVRYFRKRHKIPERDIAAMSFAGAKPLFPKDSRANARRNQRIDFLVLTDEIPY